jgi:hypothetical protein
LEAEVVSIPFLIILPRIILPSATRIVREDQLIFLLAVLRVVRRRGNMGLRGWRSTSQLGLE